MIVNFSIILSNIIVIECIRLLSNNQLHTCANRCDKINHQSDVVDNISMSKEKKKIILNLTTKLYLRD